MDMDYCNYLMKHEGCRFEDVSRALNVAGIPFEVSARPCLARGYIRFSEITIPDANFDNARAISQFASPRLSDELLGGSDDDYEVYAFHSLKQRGTIHQATGTIRLENGHFVEACLLRRKKPELEPGEYTEEEQEHAEAHVAWAEGRDLSRATRGR